MIFGVFLQDDATSQMLSVRQCHAGARESFARAPEDAATRFTLATTCGDGHDESVVFFYLDIRVKSSYFHELEQDLLVVDRKIIKCKSENLVPMSICRYCHHKSEPKAQIRNRETHC